MTATTATAPPAPKSATGDKAPTTLRNCNCGTVKDGKAFAPGKCTAQTRKSFAQGHDARMSARIAIAIATKQMTEEAGIAAIRAAGGGDQLVSKTRWSAALRAKRGNKPAKAAKLCRSCNTAEVAKKGDAKKAGLCEECNEQALDDNERSDNGEAEADDTATTQAQIKIGRWTYPAKVSENGDAEYTNKRGETMTAVAGSFSIVK